MATVVKKTSVKKVKGRLYFLDKKGDVASVAMARGKKGKRIHKTEEKTGIKREKGYLYFIGKNGDVCKAKQARGGKKKKKK